MFDDQYPTFFQTPESGVVRNQRWKNHLAMILAAMGPVLNQPVIALSPSVPGTL